MSKKDLDLLPCPFCGSNPVVSGGLGEENMIIACHNEDCGMACAEYGTIDEMVERWNRRASKDTGNNVQQSVTGSQESKTLSQIAGRLDVIASMENQLNNDTICQMVANEARQLRLLI